MRSFSLAILGLFSAVVSATPTSIPRDDTVLTPKGHIPAANVQQIPEGGHVLHVGDEVHVIDASNTTVNIRKVPATNGTVPAYQTGWVADANWFNSGSHPISDFETTWTVPPVPPKQNGQTLFLFNAIEPGAYNGILQPVLQYGPSAAGGGAYWAVASWYGVNNVYYHTTPKKVSPGKVLKGVMKLTQHTSGSSKYSYRSYFDGISGTTMTAKNVPELKWATETLEVYGITSKSDFPKGSTVFSKINLKTTAGYPSGVKWATVGSTKDGITTKVNTQGSKNAKVTIKY
ncbi:hypothetical protein DL93DRAFT_2157688 [Clavulina sp. PMI_390]|nr:hypothetical protein DL93DRAFT_2157688 [Clavulina sp. PMI_390]